MPKPADLTRKEPRQPRARATFDAILTATAQLLRQEGAARVTTNRIAERAGVSIGFL
jgi:AcrR family transcriptional regulator